LIKYASESGNRQIENDIVQTLADSRQNDRSLLTLSGLLKDENSLKYFDGVADKAREIISSQKGKSGIGKIFGGIFGSGDDNREKTNKKEVDK